MNDKITQLNNLGKRFKKRLLKSNNLFRPDKLVDFNSSYHQYSPLFKNSKLWQNRSHKETMEKQSQQDRKHFILLSGISAGGKDAIRETIQELFPKFMYKVVTATSRKPRLGETEGTDYYFYPSNRAFLEAAKNNVFLSYTPVSLKCLYGLPFKSIKEAFNRPEPLICSHSDIRAWPELQEYVIRYCQNMNILVNILKIFVMPEMTAREYFDSWLPDHRSDHKRRSNQAAWEIHTAPELTDIIIVNPIRESEDSLIDVAKSLVTLLIK